MTVLIVIQEPSGRRAPLWQTHLTDHECIIRRRRHAGPAEALGEVARLMKAGHTPAFKTALHALMLALAPATLPERIALVAV